MAEQWARSTGPGIGGSPGPQLKGLGQRRGRSQPKGAGGGVSTSSLPRGLAPPLLPTMDQSPRPPVLSASEKTRPPPGAEDPTALSLTPPAGLSPAPEDALLHWTALVCMMVFVSAFSIGFGPGRWESSAGNLEAFCLS